MITDPAIRLVVSLALLLGGYLVGSILPADLFFRLSRKKAPLEMGEKPGTYAVIRRVGLVPGILCLLFDFGKGFLPGFLAITFGLDPAWLPFITVSSVVGHNWPFLRWNKGGWGMAATGGTFLALGWWLPAILAATVAIPCGLLWRSKPGLAIGGVGFPLFLAMLFVFHKPWINFLTALLVMAVEIYRRLTGERRKKAAVTGSRSS